MIATSWVIGALTAIPSAWPCCYVFYYPNELTWHFDYELEYGRALIGMDLGATFGVTFVILICNVLIFTYVHQMHKLVSGSLRRVTHENVRRNREFKLFIQFFIIATWLVVYDVCYNALSRAFDHSKWVGLVISWLYIGQCSINGYVYLALNSSLRKQLKNLFGRRQTNRFLRERRCKEMELRPMQSVMELNDS